MSPGTRFLAWACCLGLVIALFPALARADADYGDAPSSYGSASAGSGSYEWLGSAWDAESAPQYSADARGDDLLGINDEDGMQLVWDSANNSWAVDVTMAVLDRNYRDPVTFKYRYTYGGSSGGAMLLYLRGWWDSNEDGVFDPTGERFIFAQFNPRAEWTTNTQTVHYLLPGFAPKQPGDYFRFRLSYGGTDVRAVGPTGFVDFGEVEDYWVTPEPSTIALLGGALVMLIRRRRRGK